MDSSKKTQATLFMILAVFIFLVLISLLIFNSNNINLSNLDRPLISKQQANSVKNYLELCLSDSVKESLILLGRSGMMHEATSHSQVLFSIEYRTYSDNSSDIMHLIDIIPYYIINGNPIINNIPSISLIEEQYSKSVNKLFLYCATENNSFENQGIQLAMHNDSIGLSISDGLIIAESKHPIKIIKQGETLSSEEIYYVLNYNFVEKYNLVNIFVKHQLNSMEYAEIGYLLDLAYENNFTYNTNYVEGGIMKYDLIFDDYIPFSDEPFIYSFLIDYGWQDGK